MDIEKIEKLLSDITRNLLESEQSVPAFYLLPYFQCRLLLHIYKKLESIDYTLSTIGEDSWNDHHNK